MIGIIQAEWYKFVRNRIYPVLFGSGVILSWILESDQRTREGSVSLHTGLYNAPLIFIIINIFCALYFGYDFHQRTVNDYISCGHSRTQIIFGKFVFYIVYSNLILLFFPILNTILNTYRYGWGNSYFKNIGEGISVILVTLILNTANCCVLLLIAVIFKDIGRTLTFSTVLYFLTIFLLNSKNALTLAHFIPLGQMRLLIGERTQIPEALCLGFFYSICALGISAIYFNKCELK